MEPTSIPCNTRGSQRPRATADARSARRDPEHVLDFTVRAVLRCELQLEGPRPSPSGSRGRLEGLLPRTPLQSWEARCLATQLEIDGRVVAVGSADMDEDGTTVATRRIARKVYLRRLVGNLPVTGSRMVFTFANDGTLRRARGAWPRRVPAGIVEASRGDRAH
jgi:hypothetical protein